MTNGKDVLRVSGLMERFQITRQDLQMYNTVAVTATYKLNRSALANAGLEYVIYMALKRVISQHALLSVTVDAASSVSPQWRALNRFDIAGVTTVEKDCSPSKVQQVMLEGHRRTIEMGGSLPLWRVVVAERSKEADSSSDGVCAVDIGFFFHHSIGDGVSGATFHVGLVEALRVVLQHDDKVEYEPNISVLEQGQIVLPPNLELATPLPLSLWFILKLVFTTFIYAPAAPKSWTGPPVRTTAPSEPHLNDRQTFFLSPSIVNKLLVRCRAESSSLTALLATLVAHRLAQIYPEHTMFVGKIPFDMRKFTKVPRNTMGNFISDAEVTFSSELYPSRSHVSCAATNSTEGNISDAQKTFWDATRRTKCCIQESASTTGDQNVGMLKYVGGDLRGFFLGKLGGKREGAFEISNIGVVDGGIGSSDDCSAIFDRISMSSSTSPYAAPYAYTVASAKGGDLGVCLNWEDGVIAGEVARGMQDWLEEKLISIAED